jgi:ubiquinone/menaquinone biosynthesis C-methylase UbiE
VDLTPEMLEWPRAALGDWKLGNVEFQEADVEELPFAAGSFDLVISNGVLNLVSGKAAVFREIFRVLAPGGALATADLLVEETIPAEVLQDVDAWST